MRGHLIMSAKERRNKVYLEQVLSKHSTLKEASEQMGLSYRQAKRIMARYKAQGDKGLVHKNRGIVSNRRYDPILKAAILARYQERYEGFGPTFAAEKLTEDNLRVHRETLRGWLIAAGLWRHQRNRSPYRQQRPRRERFGELLQLDGSHHEWFGKGNGFSCLMNLVDDATGTTLALLAPQETTQAAMEVLWAWIRRYGVPKAIYVDLKTVYVSAKTTNPESDEPPGYTHFSRACAKLGIRLIKAYSPQAKGRVERKHAVFQDRFVKELLLQGITTLEGANRLLAQGFVDSLNQKFAIAPALQHDAHRSLPHGVDLHQVFCWEYTRQLQHDWTLAFEGKIYQLDKPSFPRVRPKQNVLVRQHLQQTISVWTQDNHPLSYRIIPARLTPPKPPAPGHNPTLLSEKARKNKRKSPWNQFNPDWLKSKATSLPKTHTSIEVANYSVGVPTVDLWVNHLEIDNST